MRMTNASEAVRFLDNVDLTFSLDSRSSSSQQMVNMDINVKPIIFRASYRDINLIMNITNKALELYGTSANSSPKENEGGDAKSGTLISQDQKSSRVTTRGKTSKALGSAHVVTSKEQVGINFNVNFWYILTSLKAESFDRRTPYCADRRYP